MLTYVCKFAMAIAERLHANNNNIIVLLLITESYARHDRMHGPHTPRPDFSHLHEEMNTYTIRDAISIQSTKNIENFLLYATRSERGSKITG
jgi:hypothetical protein